MAGFSWARGVSGALRGGFKSTPFGGAAMGFLGSGFGGQVAQGFSAFGAAPGGMPRKRRRSRSMFIRKGRLYMGYSQKDVKMAMRRTYGGKRK